MGRVGQRTDDRIPLLLTLPGLRRYAEQIRRLRAEVDEAHRNLDELRADRAAQEEWIRQAKNYEYYWANAAKKIDVRQLDPFGPLAERVMSHGRTYLGIDRLYTLWQLVATLPKDAQAVAEIGAYRGGSARFVAESLRLCGREMPFYVCDTFEGHVEVDETIDGLHRAGVQFLRANADKVARYLEKFPFAQVIQGDIRETASNLAGQYAFGLVHVDVDVYPITRFCLEYFGPRIVAGGAILVDDYATTTCQGVKKAVDEFSQSRPGFRSLHLLTGQAVVTRC